MRKLTLIFASLLIALSGLTLVPHKAAAFTASDVMDDVVFDGNGSMSASQIDSFLNTFSGSCISTNAGFSAPDPTGYSPSTGFTYGGNVSAGQVIYDAAQAYGLNPQVLITTLQKEQSLVSGDAGCSTLRYVGAVGYGCPDGGTTYDYSDLNLYTINGVTTTSVSGTCVNAASKAGFSQQVIHGAWLLKFGEQRSEGNTGWAVIKGNWDNSDDPQTCYGGPMTQGSFKRCASDSSSVYYDGYITIDSSSTHMDNGATAALYWYTPHFAGNQSFDTIFSNWFGPVNGDPPTAPDMENVFRLSNYLTKERIYTPDVGERNSLAGHNGWVYEGVAFEAPLSADTPVYRLANWMTHDRIFTANASEKNSLLGQKGWTFEGIAFYVRSSDIEPVYRLNNTSTHERLWTANANEKNTLLAQNNGWVNEGVAWYVGVSSDPPPPAGMENVYRLVNPTTGERLYTANVSERNSVINNGWAYEGVAFQAPLSGNTPVYRLANASDHDRLFTPNLNEKNTLVSQGWTYEGIGFYENSSYTQNVFRLVNSRTNQRVLTTSVTEKNTLLNDSDWVYEGVTFNVPNLVTVYRMSNWMTHERLYTTSLDEVNSINQQNGWLCEGIAFLVYPTGDTPVYRLAHWQNHDRLFTAWAAEKNTLVSQGWTYEGIGFYSDSTYTQPVYRLVNSKTNERLLTVSSGEKNNLLAQPNWVYEGVGFNVP